MSKNLVFLVEFHEWMREVFMDNRILLFQRNEEKGRSDIRRTSILKRAEVMTYGSGPCVVHELNNLFFRRSFWWMNGKIEVEV